MAVLFTRNRLHVGFRQCDWSDVWFEPAGHLTEDGEANLGLYKFTTGEAGKREPMEGEVLWLPAFDLANCESKKLREKEKMQRQFLTDAYVYLAEKDPEKVREMEEEFDRPHFSRWRKWFEHAKKWKRTKMRERDSRRKRREDKLRAAGRTEAEIRKEVDSDTSDDSTYGSDAEERLRRRAEDLDAAQQMPPPAPGRPEKRKAAPGARKAAAAKKPKPNHGHPPPSRENQSPDASTLMSGGLSGEVNSAKRSWYIRTHRDLHGNRADTPQSERQNYEDSASEADFDSREPQFGSFSPGFNWQEQFPRLPEANGPRTRGRSTSARGSPNAPRRGGQAGGNEDEDARAIKPEFEGENNGLSDEQALEEAIRRSQVPEEMQGDANEVNGGLDEEGAIEEAMRESQQPSEEGGERGGDAAEGDGTGEGDGD